MPSSVGVGSVTAGHAPVGTALWRGRMTSRRRRPHGPPATVQEDDVEFPGIGGSRTGQAVKDVRSALEQAEAGPQDEGVLGNQATRLVQNILDLGIDGKGCFHSAAKVADDAAGRAPRPGGGGRRDRAPATSGSARHPASSPASAGSSPCRWPCRPTCSASTCIATRMTAAIAKVRGYDLAPGADPHGGAAHPGGRRRRRPAQEGRHGRRPAAR